MAVQLTRIQREVLETIANFVRSSGRFPFLKELAEERDKSRQAQWSVLQPMKAAGVLELEEARDGWPQQVVLTPAGMEEARLSPEAVKTFGASPIPPSKGIPLVGYIGASPFLTPESRTPQMLPLPGTPDSFAMIVNFNSMADYFLEGDVVVCRRVYRQPKRREICAVWDEEENKTTLKYVTVKGSVAQLDPHNTAEFETIQMPAERLVVQGVYDYMLRGRSPEDLLRTLGVAA